MSSITAGTSSGSALVSAGDTTGDLILNVNNATASLSLKANGSIGVGPTPSYGTAGQVLTSNGSSSAPSWGSAGAVVFISSTIVSSATASVAFTGLSNSTYAYYILEISRMYFATADTPYCYFSSNNGSTYYASPDYNYMSAAATTGSVVNGYQISGSPPQLVPTVGTTGGSSMSAVIEIHNAGASGGLILWRAGSRNDSLTPYSTNGSGGLYSTANTFNTIKIQGASSYNITAGNFYLYGVTKA